MIRSSVTDVSSTKLVFTCEHGGHRVPPSLKYLEKIQSLDFNSHYTWDPGALETTQFLSAKLEAKYFANPYSRLLIDCNRSDDNPSRFPKWTRTLSPKDRLEIESRVLTPYKSQVRQHVKNLLSQGQNVVLISMHSFTPFFKDKERATEIGVLYRPFKPQELILATALVSHLKDFSDFKVHHNRPYQGHTDCFLNELLAELESPRLTGVMFELNYGLLGSQKRWRELQWVLASAIRAVVG